MILTTKININGYQRVQDEYYINIFQGDEFELTQNYDLYIT